MNKETASPALKTIDIDPYEKCSVKVTLRKDLHLYVNHIQNRWIKRSVRENKLPKADAKRIANLLANPDAVAEINEEGESTWVNFIDELALTLGFTIYDTKGKYQGYSSASPAFSDNYIDFDDKAYQQFLALPLQKQEQFIFDTLIGKFAPGYNEFISRSFFGRLDRFSSMGFAGGVIPGIKFDKVRKFLFSCLKACKPGVWYETASLVRYLKKEHPFFLIPKKPTYEHKWEKEQGRYCNFSEYDNQMNKNEKISEKDPDAFERVEGRFVERFLENIPLTLGYVDLAYDMPVNPEKRPSMGNLKAFKINECFSRFMNGEISEPHVTVHPNHEIHLESEFYPASMLNRLTLFSDLVTSDRICILKLNRMKAVQYMADDKSLDLKGYLQDLTGNPLPPNIAAELDEWAGHSETFILYRGCGLHEGNDLPPLLKDFKLEALSPSLRLVRSPDDLFSRLEKDKRVPMLITHGPNAFTAPPDGVKSVFTRKKKKGKKTKTKALMTITKKPFITLLFETDPFLDAFVKALIREKCTVEINKTKRSITYAAEQKKQLDAVMKQLKKRYQIKIVGSMS